MNHQQSLHSTVNYAGPAAGGVSPGGASLKVKLNQLEVTLVETSTISLSKQELVSTITEEIHYNKKEVVILRQEKESLENVLSVKAHEVRKTLTTEANR